MSTAIIDDNASHNNSNIGNNYYLWRIYYVWWVFQTYFKLMFLTGRYNN